MKKEYNNYILEESDNSLTMSFLNKSKDFFTQFPLLLLAYFVGVSAIYYGITSTPSQESLSLVLSLVLLVTTSAFVGGYLLAWKSLTDKEILLNKKNLLYMQKLYHKGRTKVFEWEDIERFKLKEYKNLCSVELRLYDGKKYEISTKLEKLEAQRVLFKLNGYRSNLFPSQWESVA